MLLIRVPDPLMDADDVAEGVSTSASKRQKCAILAFLIYMAQFTLLQSRLPFTTARPAVEDLAGSPAFVAGRHD